MNKRVQRVKKKKKERMHNILKNYQGIFCKEYEQTNQYPLKQKLFIIIIN